MDFHIHGSPWTHGWTNYRRSAWNGYQAGCEIIGFAEHAPRMNPELPFKSLYFRDLEKYFDILEEIRVEFAGKLEVFKGLEIDYHEGMVEHYRRLIPELPLDFTAGAVHSVNNWIVDLRDTLSESEYRDADAYELYDVYFQQIQKAAQTGLFDFIVHADYVKKILVHRRWKKPDNLAKIYRETAEILAVHNTGIEINTRGMLLPEVGEYYPDFEFLKSCVQAGVPLTIGSDSHDGRRVGDGFESAVRQAREAGYKALSFWRNRESININL